MAIERDNWQYVWANSPEAARAYFDVPPETEVRPWWHDGNHNTLYAVRIMPIVHDPRPPFLKLETET